MSEKKEKERRRFDRMERSLAEIKAAQRPPEWKESSFFWGLLGTGMAALAWVVKPFPGFQTFLLILAWLCFSGSCWIIFRDRWPARRFIGTCLLSPMIGVLILVLWVYTDGGPIARLSIGSERNPYPFVPQGNQPVPLKARQFARIMVTAEVKSIANVRAFVTKIDGADHHHQLYLSSRDTASKFLKSLPIEQSVNLNPGDEQYFDALIECNGTVCGDGEFAIPSIQNGERVFISLFEDGVDVRPRTLTIRATGDGVDPVTETFTLLREQNGRLLLKSESGG